MCARARYRTTGAPRRITTSSTSLSHYVDEYGPDELVVLLEGPELLPARVRYVGGCRYVARCGPVQHAGVYHLLAMHLRSEYDALDEVRGSSSRRAHMQRGLRLARM